MINWYLMHIDVDPAVAQRLLADRLPVGGRVAAASLEITRERASVDVLYFGVKPDGTPHRRRSSALVDLPVDLPDARDWLNALFPGTAADGTYHLRRALLAIWPKHLEADQGRTNRAHEKRGLGSG